MRLWIHRYTLVPKKRLGGVAREGVRRGALLRAGDGFADVHPWPELGDAPLDEQLASLARGETTPLTRCSLRLAAADGEARKRGVSLFDGLEIPMSHWPGAEPPSEFDTAKVKGVGGIPPNVRVRIDFNGTLTPDAFLRVAATLPKERLDFVEDPCVFEEDTWAELRRETGLRLALDRWADPEWPPPSAFDVVIHKPAVQEHFPAHHDVVVTSYMDHPVGQFGAAWVAATHDVNARCGLFTHVLYEPDAFIERITAAGAQLQPPAGTGIGFDDLLERLEWTSIG